MVQWLGRIGGCLIALGLLPACFGLLMGPYPPGCEVTTSDADGIVTDSLLKELFLLWAVLTLGLGISLVLARWRLERSQPSLRRPWRGTVAVVAVICVVFVAVTIEWLRFTSCS